MSSGTTLALLVAATVVAVVPVEAIAVDHRDSDLRLVGNGQHDKAFNGRGLHKGFKGCGIHRKGPGLRQFKGHEFKSHGLRRFKDQGLKADGLRQFKGHGFRGRGLEEFRGRGFRSHWLRQFKDHRFRSHGLEEFRGCGLNHSRRSPFVIHRR